MVQTNVSRTLKWTGEVTFEGTADEFNSFIGTLSSYRVAVSIPPSKFVPGSYAGYIRPIESIFTKGMLERLSEGSVRTQIPVNMPCAITSPHIHVGQEVILVSKEQFKTFLGEVARHIAEKRVETESDFYAMIKPFVKCD